jgi:hypothetical protein
MASAPLSVDCVSTIIINVTRAVGSVNIVTSDFPKGMPSVQSAVGRLIYT